MPRFHSWPSRFSAARFGARAELTFLVLLVANPFVLTTLPTVAAYTAPVALGLCIAGAGLLSLPRERGALLFGAGLGLACAVRIAYAPLALVAGIVLARRSGARAAVWFALGGFGSLLLCSGPALESLGDWRTAYAELIEAQLIRRTTTPYLFQVHAFGNKLEIGGALLLHLASSIVALLLARRALGSLSSQARQLLLLALAATVLHLLPVPIHLVYFAAIALVFFGGVSLVLARAQWSLTRVASVAVLGVACQTTVFLGTQRYPFAWVAEAASALIRPDARLERVAHAVAARVRQGGQLWTFDTTIAVDAGRPLLPGFEMSYFGLYANTARAYADRHHVLSVDAAVEPPTMRRAALVVASKLYTWQLLANDPSGRSLIWRRLCENYRPVEYFNVFHYSGIWLFEPCAPNATSSPDPSCERLFDTDAGHPLAARD